MLQESDIICVASAKCDRLIAFGLRDGTMKVLDSFTKNVVFRAYTGSVLHVAFNPNGSFLAVGPVGQMISVWNTSIRFHLYQRNVSGIAVSRDGQKLATSSNDGVIRLWHIDSGERIWTSQPVWSEIICPVFSSEGDSNVSATRDDIARISDAGLETEMRFQPYWRGKKIHDVSISRNRLQVASPSYCNNMKLWDAKPSAELGWTAEHSSLHEESVNCGSLSHDGQLTVSGSEDKSLRLWDERCTLIGCIHHGLAISSCSCTTNVLGIVSASFDKMNKTGNIRIWDTQTDVEVTKTFHQQEKEELRKQGLVYK